MATRVGALEAKNKFSELMEKVAHRSERFLVERRGKAMMAMVPVADLERLEATEQTEAEEAEKRAFLAYLEEAERIRTQILADLGGELLPPMAELLREAREEGLE